MWYFKRKTTIESDVLDTLYKRLDKLESKVRKLESESLDLNSTIDSLRNKVLRKIQKKDEIEEETIKKPLMPGDAYPW